MYSILIKEKPNTYRFLTVKKEVMKEETQQVDDGSGNLVDKVVQVPTGTFETVVYEETDRDEFEKKCIEMLNTYNATEFIPINTESYSMDLIWQVNP